MKFRAEDRTTGAKNSIDRRVSLESCLMTDNAGNNLRVISANIKTHFNYAHVHTLLIHNTASVLVLHA